MKPLVCFLAVVSALIGGCAAPSPVKEEPAIAVAKREALEKWGWRKVEVSSADFVDGKWIIRLTMIPETPGGHATIQVSEDGRILDYRGGR